MPADEQNHLYLMLGRIEAKLDYVLQRQAKTDEDVEALAERVSLLESNKAWVIGAATALSTLCGYGIPFLTDRIMK